MVHQRLLSLIAFAAYVLPHFVAGGEEAPAFRTKFNRELIDSQPMLACKRVDSGPLIDGEVDRKALWQTCDHTQGAWVQLGSKTVSGRQTVVYSCYDKENLYFGFVCEEPELQNVHMDGRVAGRLAEATDDFVEVILEVGGLWGDGEVYSFRANLRGQSQAWGISGIPAPEFGAYTPIWKSAGKFGPNRWMQEMAIPFASLKRRPEDKGPATPLRGDVLGLKLARYGAVQADVKQRMISTFNVQIPYNLLYMCGYNGLLCFEDSNALSDGGFALSGGASPWKQNGAIKAGEKGGVTLGAGAVLTQEVAVQPSSFYLLTAAADGNAQPELFAGEQKLALANSQAGFFTNADQHTAALSIKAAAPVALNRITMELQPGEEPFGPMCLTNNYRRAERNLRARLPDAPEGKYCYLKLDYNGNQAGEDHPSCAYDRDWSYDKNLAVEDVGGTKGWIPFSAGTLTGKSGVVFWQTENPRQDPVGWGRHQYSVIDIDLGQEYFVQGVDILWPAPYTLNAEIWGKPEGAKEWTYLYTGSGPFVEPSKRKGHPRGYERIRGLDSVVRYVRWRATQLLPAFPQMDGIQKFWVWGQPKGEHSGLKAFLPWIDTKGAAPVAAQTDALDPEACLIVPRPRELKLDQGWFTLNAQTRIVAQNHPSAKQIARQIHDEILERWTLDLAVAEEQASTVPAENTIYLGQPQLAGLAPKLLRDEGLEFETKRPQGYALKVAPQHATVLGNDNDGLYYGVQSLMMAMRWRNGGEGEKSGPAVRCLKAKDWPGTFERALSSLKPQPLNVPGSQLWRIKRMCQILSRFKINAFYISLGRIGPIYDWNSDWGNGTLAKLCREVREEFHLELRPMLLNPEIIIAGWWRSMADETKNFNIAEADPDEYAAELGSAMNVCPLDPQTYERLFPILDQILEEWNHPSRVWLYGQAYANTAAGARWAVCRRCQRSGKTQEEIYAFFLRRIEEHLEGQQAHGLLNCPFLRFGPRDPKDRRLLSMDLRNLPEGLLLDLLDEANPGASEIPNLQKAFEAQSLNPALTVNGPVSWPSNNRYKRYGGPPHALIGGMIGGSAGAEEMWYAPDKRPSQPIDFADLGAWLYSRWYHWDFPSWRAGERPKFSPLDLRKIVNQTSRPTGTETLEAGRLPAVDLRYMPMGRQTLAGVPFELIDPAQNDGKALLALGRPPASTPAKLAATIPEEAGPVPVEQRLASLAFLHTLWECAVSGIGWPELWLRPTCRVVYDDGSWLAVDAFYGGGGANPFDTWSDPAVVRPYERQGWLGNCPAGNSVSLPVTEWINPYPEKPIKQLEFFTPPMFDRFGKRVNPKVQVIAAITGVEPVEQDFVFWRARQDRPPLLPPPKPPAQKGVELKTAESLITWFMVPEGGSVPRYGNVKSSELEVSWKATLATPQGNIGYFGKLLPSSAYYPYGGLYEGVVARHDFVPFGAEQHFEKPVRLCRVEIIGPRHNAPQNDTNISPRFQKVDVALELSEDGKAWRKAGELRGLSFEADFQFIEFPPAEVKALRLTASAEHYQESYQPHAIQNAGMFVTAALSPHFNWRLFAPEEAVEKKK